MEKYNVALLLENLLERVELNSTTGKHELGIISIREIAALKAAIVAFGGEIESAATPAENYSTNGTKINLRPPVEGESRVSSGVASESCTTEPLSISNAEPFKLNLKSLELTAPESPELTLCIDFGTAMSKAFAMKNTGTPIELALGVRAGVGGFPVDSSLFITDEGLLFFGPQAMEKGFAAAETGRNRYDSLKARLSMGEPGEIDNIPVSKEINPTTTPFSEGELITLYLGYLTDLAASELENQGFSRYVRRRFARPSWPDVRNKWAEPLLRRMLAHAQILADTFTDRWQQGIPVTEGKRALENLKAQEKIPDYLLDEGIPEPVAAAASLMLRDEAQRELFMVIDVGAGTTDFGVFLLQHNPDKDVCLTRIVPNTIEYLGEAGNRVDDLLKYYVLDSEGIDPGGAEGRLNKSYLEGRIRLYKETLFRDGVVEVVLANHSRVVVDRDEFLQSTRVQNFAERLKNKVHEVLGRVGDGYLGLMARSDLKVVLTGGGASLPMIQDLAHGVVEIRGMKILKKPTATVPEWVEESYPQFAPQYPQLAVAIGGAAPELPGQGEGFVDFMGI